MTEFISVALISFGCLCFFYGLFLGHNIGVKETERRWSDAVGRKNDV